MAYDGPFAINPEVAAFIDRAPRLFIDGIFTASDGNATLNVYDPSSGKVIAEAVDASPTDVDRAVQAAHRAFEDGRWRLMRPADRERILLYFADLVAARSEIFAQLDTLEQGKSIHLSRGLEVTYSIDWMRYIAGLATKITGKTFDTSLPGGPAHWTSFTRRQPIGVVAGIAPWNFPMMIALWKIMPALAAGCSIVLKPSEVTPLTALMLAEVAIEAGVPAGVFNVITGCGAVAGSALARHPLVAKISFTGSVATGKAIGRVAMEDLKRVTLELGGKNPAIVLKDADLPSVVEGLMAAGFLNGGQICAAASRVYVEAPLFDDLISAIDVGFKGMRVGAGMDPDAQITPLASLVHQRKVRAYLDEARASGSEVRVGPDVPDEGYFVPPAMVLNPDAALRSTSEEVFGPLLGLTRVADAEEAIARANAVDTGLCASVWTKDLGAAMTITPRIKAGTVWVNAHLPIDANMPFGGFKQSGIGRDFGVDWLDAYTEVQAVCINH
ncbi:MAG: Phenylacetaldehyde dehydrogenase [Sphingomonadales bacterium]|nr:Phenylacetaldehyde dehydrogenase [Sphingomonadales bacterium]